MYGLCEVQDQVWVWNNDLRGGGVLYMALTADVCCPWEFEDQVITNHNVGCGCDLYLSWPADAYNISSYEWMWEANNEYTFIIHTFKQYKVCVRFARKELNYWNLLKLL